VTPQPDVVAPRWVPGTKPPEVRRLAALDLGSNSFHILVADVLPDGFIQPVLREREMLHLGGVVAEHGRIDGSHLASAVATVRHFAELARRTGVDHLLPIATAAIRDAENADEVVAALSEAAGVPVRVVDGGVEAALAYRGVRAACVFHDEPVLCVDLGGGSLELAIGSRADLLWRVSLPIGVSRLEAALVRKDPLSNKDRQRIRDAVDEAVLPILPQLQEHAWQEVALLGGTVRALARVMLADTSPAWQPMSVNMTLLPAVRFGQWAEKLAVMTAEERSAVRGMKSKRAEHVHIAALILAAVFDRVGIADVRVSDWGLREGAILEAVGMDTVPDRATLRRRAASRLRESFVPDDPHLEHVAHLAVRLFDDLRDIHGLDDRDRDLLANGALLHDLGEAINLRGHHHHGAYLLEHSEIRGFSPNEVAMLCSLVRFHKSRGLSEDYPPFASLRSDRQDRVRRMVPILQLADGLDRARDQGVHDVTCSVTDDRVLIEVHRDELHVSLDELHRKTWLFERTFGVEVEVADVDGNGSVNGDGSDS